MQRKELKYCTLDSLVKLTPQGKVYKVVMSNKSKWEAALEDANGKTKEVKSQFVSVYIVKMG